EEADTAVLELTYNWGVDKYELGSAYGHVAIAVDDAYKACEDVKRRGGKVTREAGPMKHGTTVIAFVEDPDGYKIELIQRKSHRLRELRSREPRPRPSAEHPRRAGDAVLADLALLPDQSLGEVVEHALVDLLRRDRQVLDAEAEHVGRLEVELALLVIGLENHVGEHRGRHDELGAHDETLRVLLLFLDELDLAEPQRLADA